MIERVPPLAGLSTSCNLPHTPTTGGEVRVWEFGKLGIWNFGRKLGIGNWKSEGNKEIRKLQNHKIIKITKSQNYCKILNIMYSINYVICSEL